MVKQIHHQLSGQRIQPKNVAAIAGSLLDLARSNTRLHGLPQQLMKHAGKAVATNRRRWPTANTRKVWGATCPMTVACRLCLQECAEALKDPVPRILRPSNTDVWVLQTDSSDYAWGASLLHEGREVQACAQSWSPTDRLLHITHKEAKASARALDEVIDQITHGSLVRI